MQAHRRVSFGVPAAVAAAPPIIPSALPVLEHALETFRSTSARLSSEADTTAEYIRNRKNLESAAQRQRVGPQFPFGSLVYRFLDARRFDRPPRTFLVLGYDPVTDRYMVRATDTNQVQTKRADSLQAYTGRE
jgi:hypothetical protein